MFYDKEVAHLFDWLDEIEERLSTSRFLLSEQLTEADRFLFPALIWFDVLFKCIITNNGL
ncbi:glutathione S-transferase C-terminal domain-containing protein [Tetragenococcus solitarius]